MKKLIYTPPAMTFAEVELEQGIAATSGTATATPPATIKDYEEGTGGSAWEVDGF